MKNNRQYAQMLCAAKEKLSGRDPAEVARAAGLLWNGRAIEADTLGIPIQIHWPDCKIVPQLDLWHSLTILQCLAGTKGTPLTGRFVSLSDFREGGLARGSSFDRENDRIIGKIGKSDAAAIRDAAAKLGGTVIQGKADMTIRFSFLPNFPLVLNLWLEDEDFPASGKVLLDAAIESAVQVEAAGTAAGILLAMLEEKLQK